MEASLLQAYAPRDPLAEVLRGDISLRKFRVMCEGIPRTPHTPVGRKINGPWGDEEQLLHIVAQTLLRLSAAFYNVHRAEGSEAVSPPDLPRPPLTEYQAEVEAAPDVEAEYQAEVEASLLAVLNQE